MNGIRNKFEDFNKSLLYEADIAGYNVQGIFCPTFGATTDLFCCQQALFNGAAFEGTRELQRKMQEFHKNSDPGVTVLVIPHSRGAMYARNAFKDSPQHLRNRVDVRPIAPGEFISQTYIESIRDESEAYINR